jgi:hypothetical protein
MLRVDELNLRKSCRAYLALGYQHAFAMRDAIAPEAMKMIYGARLPFWCSTKDSNFPPDLLGLYSAQNFISRLPHGDQTHHQADKWKSLRYRLLRPRQAHHSINPHNTSLSPNVRRVCAIAGRKRGCSQDREPLPHHPHPCRPWTPRRVDPEAAAHRVRNM